MCDHVTNPTILTSYNNHRKTSHLLEKKGGVLIEY